MGTLLNYRKEAVAWLTTNEDEQPVMSFRGKSSITKVMLKIARGLKMTKEAHRVGGFGYEWVGQNRRGWVAVKKAFKKELKAKGYQIEEYGDENLIAIKQ